MKRFVILFSVLLISTMSYSQIKAIDMSVEEHAEKEYDMLMAILHRQDPDLTMNVNQRINLMKVMRKRSEEIIAHTYDNMGKNEWYEMYQDVNQKYRSEIIRSLDLKHRQAYVQRFAEKVK